MPVRVDSVPPPPADSKQPGIAKTLLYNGSKFQGFQKSKGSSYEVEVVLQVSFHIIICSFFMLRSYEYRKVLRNLSLEIIG